jgi:hypothetical protein
MGKFKNNKSALFSASASLILVFALTGCGPATFSGSGFMSVPDKAFGGPNSTSDDKEGDECNLFLDSTKYPDIQEGTSVTLRDSTGAVVGLSRLYDGTLSRGWVSEPTYSGRIPAVVDDTCVLKFEFDEIKSGDEFFSVEVGNRGQVEITRSDLELGLVFVSLG